VFAEGVRIMNHMKLAIATMLMLVVFLVSNSAGANPLELYGLSSRSMGMNQAVTASARDYSALFYNPGRLGFVAPSVGAHFMFSFDSVKINLLARPDGTDYDVPKKESDILTMPTADLTPRNDTNNDPNVYMLTGGIVHDFGLYWLRVGAALSVPLSSLAAVDLKYADEREQYFSNSLQYQLLNRRASRPSFLAGVAFRPLKWFSFGASVNVFGNMVAKTEMFVDNLAEPDGVYLALDAKMKYDASVIAGIQIDPVEWFGIGISFRDKSWFGADVTNSLQVGKNSNVNQEFNYGFSFSPRTLNAGVRFDVKKFTISADAAWLRWSEFRPETDILAEDENGEKVISYSSGFHDTYYVKAGIEYRAAKWLDIRVGAGWEPSPVGEQDGRTNFVDNDKVQASCGASIILPWVKGLAIDFHVQFITLLSRSHTKKDELMLDEFPDDSDTKTGDPEGLQTNNPGWPGYSSSGFVGSVGVGVSYQFQ